MLRREYLFKRPSLGESCTKCTMRDTKSASPVSKAVSFSVMCEHSCLTRVVALLHFCCPSAVVRTVPEIVVLAINSGFWKWFLSHVGNKVVEARLPSFAKRYTSVCVQVLVFVVRFAASLHLPPRCVFGRIAHAARACAVATTGNRAFRSEVCPGDCGGIFAFTLAKPMRQFSIDSSVAKNSQLSVNISSLVFNAGRQLDRIICRHDSTPSKLDSCVEPNQSTTTASAHFILSECS